MIKIEDAKVFNIEGAIAGMRFPMQSWAKSDSFITVPEMQTIKFDEFNTLTGENLTNVSIGPNDLALAQKLIASGADSHSKFLRQIFVSMNITAPRFWWTEMDTYKVATVANSESTIHTIHKRPFTINDFSLDVIAQNNNFIIEMDTSLPEEWKDIPEYEGYYQISSWGRVKALTREIIRKDNVKIIRQERFLIPSNDNNYLRVKFTIDGVAKSLRLHRLLAEAFLINPNPDLWNIVNHIDGNKLNNNLSNLEWCSSSQNVKHAWDNKINNDSNYRKFKNGYSRRKFSEEQMDGIRQEYATGLFSYETLANKYDCGITTISRIINNTFYQSDYINNSDNSFDTIKIIIERLNLLREQFLETNDKKYWREMIELLPQSYNQMRHWSANYQVLRNIYIGRRFHKLQEWKDFCTEIEKLPYGKELITFGVKNNDATE